MTCNVWDNTSFGHSLCKHYLSILQIDIISPMSPQRTSSEGYISLTSPYFFYLFYLDLFHLRYNSSDKYVTSQMLRFLGLKTLSARLVLVFQLTLRQLRNNFFPIKTELQVYLPHLIDKSSQAQVEERGH